MRKLVSLCLFFNALSMNAQVNVKDSLLHVPMIIPQVGAHFPTGDLNKRFGTFFSAGAGFLDKTKHNWIFGADALFLFGGIVNDTNMLNNIMTDDKFLIGSDGTLYDVRFQMRGFQTMTRFGKLFPVIGPNRNSGIMITGGVGFMQHKVRIEFERNADVPQLSKDYIKGYDRLTNGLMGSASVGYVHLSSNRLLNFYVLADFSYGSTMNRRSWNYDTNSADLTKRSDGHLNFRLGWIIPFYERKPDEYYFY